MPAWENWYGSGAGRLHEADAPAAKAEPLTSRPLPVAWLIAGITVLSILTQGYVVGIINHGLQIPLLRTFAGDDAFAHDAFIQELAQTYTTVFYPAVGYLARVLPLGPLLLVLFVVFRALNTWLAYRLSLALWNDPRSALWTAAALSVQTLTFAEDIVSDIYLTHGAASQAFTLATLVLLARGRVIPAVALVGLHFNVHGMHATHLAAVVGLAALPTLKDRAVLRQYVVGGAFCALFTVPTLAWMRHAGVMGQQVPPGYVDTIRHWFPTHFWPSTWGVMDWSMFLFPVVAAVPLYRLAGATADRGITRRVASWSMGLAVLGGVTAEVWATPLLIRLHPMRLSWIMVLAGMPWLTRTAINMGRHLHTSTPQSTPTQSPGSQRVEVALSVGLLLGLAVATLYRSAYLLVLVPGLWMVLLWQRGATVRALLALATVAAAVLIPLAHLAAPLQNFPVVASRANPRGFFVVEGAVAGMAAMGVLLAWMMARQGPHSGAARKTLLGAMLTVAVLHLAARGASTAAMQVRGPQADWLAVQRFCAANLPRGATVMVPLSQIGLRAFSNQSPAVDFQEGDAMFHHPASAPTFLHKLQLYGWEPGPIVGFSHITRLDPLDAQLTQAPAVDLGHALGAEFAIRRTRHPSWNFVELFRNASFVVYQLPTATP